MRRLLPITTPSGKVITPTKGRCWMTSKVNYKKLVEDNRIWFGKTGSNVPRLKKFITEVQQGIVPLTIWEHSEVGHNQSAKQDLKNIFPNENSPFETPKTTGLIEKIIKIATFRDSIILDSFAGSGTTAHSVLKSNFNDGGTRKVILIEMEDYANDITAMRVKKVINGYGKDKKAVEGTGGAFDYYELGKPMFKKDHNLNEEVGEEKIRNYIYYTETKQPLTREQSNEAKYLMDNYQDTGYYFYYEKNKPTTLDLDALAIVVEKQEQYIIYADICLLDPEYMLNKNIIFKKIPRDIKRF